MYTVSKNHIPTPNVSADFIHGNVSRKGASKCTERSVAVCFFCYKPSFPNPTSYSLFLRLPKAPCVTSYEINPVLYQLQNNNRKIM